MFGENYVFVPKGKENYMGFGHLYPMGYKYLLFFFLGNWVQINIYEDKENC